MTGTGGTTGWVRGVFLQFFELKIRKWLTSPLFDLLAFKPETFSARRKSVAERIFIVNLYVVKRKLEIELVIKSGIKGSATTAIFL